MLSDVLTALQSTISALAAPVPIAYWMGGGQKAGRNAPPAVGWLPSRSHPDRYGPARQQGPSPLSTNSPVRSLRTRIASLEAHIWTNFTNSDKPFDDAELLLGYVINALDQNCRTSYEVLGGYWLGQEGGEILQLGRLYVLEFALHLPIVEATTPRIQSVQITSTDQIDQMPFPNSTYSQHP